MTVQNQILFGRDILSNFKQGDLIKYKNEDGETDNAIYVGPCEMSDREVVKTGISIIRRLYSSRHPIIQQISFSLDEVVLVQRVLTLQPKIVSNEEGKNNEKRLMMKLTYTKNEFENLYELHDAMLRRHNL